MDAVVRLHFQSLNFWKNVIMVLFKKFQDSSPSPFLKFYFCFLIGGTIAELIKDRKISEMESLRFLEVVLKALEFLHCKGIVHRDIKGIARTIFVSMFYIFIFIIIFCKLDKTSLLQKLREECPLVARELLPIVHCALPPSPFPRLPIYQ